MTLMLKSICQCDDTHILTSPIKMINPVMTISAYIITSITARAFGPAAIPAIMSPKRGTYKVRNEIETKRKETKRNQRKRNKTKRNETKSTKTKRKERK